MLTINYTVKIKGRTELSMLLSHMRTLPYVCTRWLQCLL